MCSVPPAANALGQWDGGGADTALGLDLRGLLMNDRGTEKDGLLIVWTSGDRDVALNMVFMYAANARKHGWWDEVTLLVWGPSQKVLTEDQELQDKLAEMVELGVDVAACKACADRYAATEDLESLGVRVFYTGQFLTEWISSAGHVITF